MTMSSGGARSRSGPPPDPSSIRSGKRGLTVTQLPADGYSGSVPDLADFLPIVTARHEAIWQDLWRSPQAEWWSKQPWRWAIVADLVEYRVRSDDPEAPTSWATVIRQLRDDLALSTAGLKMNGLTIAAASPTQLVAVPDAPVVSIGSSRDRLRK